MKLNPNRNVVLFSVVAFSLAALCLVTLALKQGRAQATENQGAAKFSGLVGQTEWVEQADPALKSRLQP